MFHTFAVLCLNQRCSELVCSGQGLGQDSLNLLLNFVNAFSTFYWHGCGFSLPYYTDFWFGLFFFFKVEKDQCKELASVPILLRYFIGFPVVLMDLVS